MTSDHFVTTWDTTLAGTSGSNQITISGTGSGYNYSIYWESIANPATNGTISPVATSSYTITFPASGQYKVAITGAFPRIYFNNVGDKAKILTVEQWGTIAWTSMANAFYGCSNLTVPATDAPDLSGVTSLDGMFTGASSFNQPINHWDVSHITSLTAMFYGASSFNQPLNNWNVSNVGSAASIFRNATAFNQPLDAWNTSSLTTMYRAFRNASSFNQSINSWDVSGIANMESVFMDARSFNQPLNSWDVSSVTNMDSMFRSAYSFNQPLNSWDVSSVTNMNNIFSNALLFNQDISTWNTLKVQTMRGMFSMGGVLKGRGVFDQNLASWNLASTTDMTDFFSGDSFSQANQDATLVGWASQTLKSNVPLNIGAKTYTAIGATALNTLRTTYNWTVTEQVILTYTPGSFATLSGTSSQYVNIGSDGTAVTVVPDSDYRFIRWSDGNTDNPRTDTAVTDHITVSAIVDTGPPAITLNSLTTPTNNPILVGSAVEETDTVVSVEYKLDSGSWTSCIADDGAFDEASETFTCDTGTPNEGQHTIYVRSTDSNSNTTQEGNYASASFTFDLTDPTKKISEITFTKTRSSDSQKPISKEKRNYTQARSLQLSGTNGDAANGTVTIFERTKKNRMKRIGTASIESDGKWSFEIPERKDGTKRYAVKFTDQAGNISESSSSFYMVRDRKKPDFIAPLPNTLQRNQTITFTAEDTVSGMNFYKVSFVGKGQNKHWIKQKTDTFTIPKHLPSGTYLFTVRATDKAGNVREMGREYGVW